MFYNYKYSFKSQLFCVASWVKFHDQKPPMADNQVYLVFPECRKANVKQT
jgi:hypothetical protein